MEMSQLRDSLYLDRDKLYSFISQIQGGKVSEISETIRSRGGISGGIELSIPTIVSGRAGASKDKENERQQTIQLTDPAYFGILYDYLKGKEIRSIELGNIQTCQGLVEGQFVEVTGTAEPPAVEHWIARIRSLVAFIDKNLSLFARTQPRNKHRPSQVLSQQQMKLFKEMVDFLEGYVQLSRKDPGRLYIRITDEAQAYSVWCGLVPDYIAAPLQAALPAKMHLVGRVERFLEKDDVYKIVDFSQFNQSSDVNNLLDALNALGTLIGQKKVSETDLQAQYPDIFVTPIAIYR